jgi:uncharacterized protein
MNMSTNIEFPKPEITPLTASYWDALAQGELLYQRCSHCQYTVLPARSECPRCLRPALEWQRASGAATLISWIVYHHAFHPAFEARLPYTVAVVQLAEGARLITNIVGDTNPEELRIDMPLLLTIEQEHGVAVPRFRPVILT